MDGGAVSAIVLSIFIVVLGVVLWCFCGAKKPRTYEHPRRYPHERQSAEAFFVTENPDVYREELTDSFVEHALWRCGVCQFRNHPERQACDLCQTRRGHGRVTLSTQSSWSKNNSVNRIGERSESGHSLPRKSSDGSSNSSTSPRGKDIHTTSNSHNRKNPGPLSKLQLAASRRQQWKRMPTTDGLHRWVRQKMKKSSSERRRHAHDNNTSTRLSSSTNYSTSSAGGRLDDRESMLSTGYVRVRDSNGKLVLNESDAVATDFHYRVNVLNPAGSTASELVMNLESLHNKPFPEKIRWFSTELHRLWLPWESGHAELVIRRTHVLQDSYQVVLAMKPFQLRQRWRVMFVDEPGLDAGGVMREWFMLVFAELFDPANGIFQSTVGDERSYWINPNSASEAIDHLSYYEFAGRLIGKAILEEHLVPVHLALPMLKHILGVPISFSDLQFLDDEIYTSAMTVKHIEDIEPLCLDFTVTRIVNGKPQVQELMEGGSEIDVTRDNKDEYLEALFRYYVMDSVSEQLLAFLAALYDVVPEGLLKLFDYQELELLMCGVPHIDMDDWRKHSDFRFYTPDAPTELELLNMQWLWEVITEMKDEQRVRLLQFATGTSRVPAQGFKGLISSDGRIRRFNVAFVGKNPPSLYPKAHTCFNRLDLPIYSSKKVLAEYLHLIVQMDITGFTIE